MLSIQIDSFINYKLNRLGSSRATEVTYRSILADFLECVGDVKVSDLSIQVIDDYANKMLLRGYKTKTLHNKLATVRSFVRWLYARDMTNLRPERIDLPRIIETEANFLTPEEQRQLLDAIEHPRDRAIVHALLASGLRISELTDLMYDDVQEKSVLVKNGKGGKARITFITPECRKDLDAYLTTKKRTEYFFTNNQKRQLSRQYVARIVTEYAKASGIEKHVSPHTLRHSFATNMLRKGARVEVVQKLMGHANIQTTLIYMHFTNPYLQSEYDKFSESMLT